jgi:hypothetical protein
MQDVLPLWTAPKVGFSIEAEYPNTLTVFKISLPESVNIANKSLGLSGNTVVKMLDCDESYLYANISDAVSYRLQNFSA